MSDHPHGREHQLPHDYAPASDGRGHVCQLCGHRVSGPARDAYEAGRIHGRLETVQAIKSGALPPIRPERRDAIRITPYHA